MKIKFFIRLFIPPIIINILYNIKRKFVKTTESPLSQIPHNSKEFVIIGNGPSLTDTISSYYNDIIEKDRIVVNHFASTDMYELLTPNIYLLVDPAFFYVPDDSKELIWNTILSIRDKTTWNLRLIVPLSAKGTVTLNMLSNNRHIQIDYYNNKNQDIGKISKFEAWDKNYLAPPAQTVLNVALYLALFWNYKEVFIIGADSSFLEDLRIDQETNDICIVDSHFYRREDVKDNRLQKNNCRVRNGIALHELIYRYGNMFEGYHKLAEYAKYKGIKVYNASEYSWINVFERKKLNRN